MTWRVDWWQVITDLMLRASLSQREIARRCDCKHSTINSLRNSITGHEPGYALGVQILAVWMVEFDLGQHDVPMVRTSTGGRVEHRGGIPQPGAIAHAPSPQDARRAAE